MNSNHAVYLQVNDVENKKQTRAAVCRDCSLNEQKKNIDGYNIKSYTGCYSSASELYTR